MGTKRTFMESGSWAAVQTECNVMAGLACTTTIASPSGLLQYEKKTSAHTINILIKVTK